MTDRFEGLACSAAAADIPLAGTAAHVTGWLCVEHGGAWGRDVIGDAVLGGELTALLQPRLVAAAVRPMLIRRPGRVGHVGRRTVLVASSVVGREFCVRYEIEDLFELLDLPLDSPGDGVPVDDPQVLVCTHGKRDQCCARLGRPIAADLAVRFPDLVWECSHTGGHRFAPSMILLPSGLTYGRVDLPAAVSAVSAARRGEVSTAGLRGRSGYDVIAQAAEVAVRSASGDMGPLDVREADGYVAVTDPDGRGWRVNVQRVEVDPRQASCGATPKPAFAIRTTVGSPVHAGNPAPDPADRGGGELLGG